MQSAILKLRWLVPGIGVKRWVLVILIGTTILGLGLTVFLLDVYHTVPEGWWIPFIKIVALQFVTNRVLRALIFGFIGVALIIVGIIGLNRALLRPFLRPGKDVIETVAEYRRKDKGPRIVVIGGGTGLTSILRGLKAYSRNITAIVTVADDGGSSGEIRKTVGILPPGDLRNCLAALSDDEEMITQIFQYRFAASAGLSGHSLGNLLITALTEITGSFESAIAESARVLSVQGNVFPSTLKNINLVAEVELPERKVTINVKGESEISQMGGKVHHVWLDPANPAPFPPTIQAILNADLILIGPGSLYTSLIANLLVPDLVDAIRASRAYKFYVCNIATQRGETDGYNCEDHIRTIERHTGARLFDVVVANNRYDGKMPEGVDWVKVDEVDNHYQVYAADLVDKENPWRHNSAKVAKTIIDLYMERTGPLSTRDIGSTI
ncbi:MAG TPA: YvcK family protein [Anaerolineaceae bacterium]|nr:YvcK family protein [Anaerolineaceae bacterium]